jgi:hypothetical protein
MVYTDRVKGFQPAGWATTAADATPVLDFASIRDSDLNGQGWTSTGKVLMWKMIMNYRIPLWSVYAVLVGCLVLLTSWFLAQLD